jgi:ankyrin repeat protein
MPNLTKNLMSLYDAYTNSQDQELKALIDDCISVLSKRNYIILQNACELLFKLLKYDDAKHLSMLFELQPALKSTTGKHSNTLLMSAIQLNANQVIEMLLAEGIDLTLRNNVGMTALHIAAHVASSQFFTLIDKYDSIYLKSKLGLGITDMHGYTPLLTAVESRNYEAARWLISEGADVNVIDCFCNNSLMHPVYNNDYKITNLMLQSKIDTSQQEFRYRYTVLMEAVYCNYYKLVALLIKSNAKTEQLAQTSETTYKTALQIATEQQSIQSRNILVAVGALIPSANNVYIRSIMKIIKSSTFNNVSCSFIIDDLDVNTVTNCIMSKYDQLKKADDDTMDILDRVDLEALSMRIWNLKHNPLVKMIVPLIPSTEICNIIAHYADATSYINVTNND